MHFKKRMNEEMHWMNELDSSKKSENIPQIKAEIENGR